MSLKVTETNSVNLMKHFLKNLVSRRNLLSGGAALVSGTSLTAVTNQAQAQNKHSHKGHSEHQNSGSDNTHIHAGEMITVGDVDHEANGFDPTDILTDWDTGTLSIGENGEKIRSFVVEAIDKDIEIAPGITFPSWTFGGRIPGPTFRATEGETLKILFRNYGSRHHSMHFHGIHSIKMDGVSASNGLIGPGEEFTYEFTAKPFGCHLYHCHALPLRHHMHKGMYGTFIVDPDPQKHPEHETIAKSRLLGTPQNQEWQELVMVMNGFDTSFDGENEFYAINTVAHHFMKHPIEIEKSRPVRVYLVNATEFDPINSFHLHANFFDYFDHGTTLTPTLPTVDTIMQCQAQRGILEFSFKDHDPGKYMFHAHQSEFAELGWMAMFDVKDT
jgi:FtsP/CotA-like multicopper oxidase with cupredoxin domain